MPPNLFGYRHVEPETARDHVERLHSRGETRARYETVHAESITHNALPFNVSDPAALPDDAGWWGYSMRDVPARVSGETFIATIPDARVVTCFDARNEFYPALLTRDGRAINLREIVFRDGHAAALRGRPVPQRFGKATWICERVYDNHSHWLTAHLPKLCLLRERGELEQVLIPQRLTPAMEASIRMMGLEPSGFLTFDPRRPLVVEELTILGTDRFRPELLRPVRDAIAPARNRAPGRSVYISRGKARMRRLLNEDEIWPLFQAAGFERVYMEEMDFPAQVELMRETRAIAAPHGAGLTNMIFCPAGARIIELAWLGFPNPNFYALAAAMGHEYAIVPAEVRGDAPPLEKDLVASPDAVRAVLAAIPPPAIGR